MLSARILAPQLSCTEDIPRTWPQPACRSPTRNIPAANGSGWLHRSLAKLHTASAPAMQGELLLAGHGLQRTVVTRPACSIVAAQQVLAASLPHCPAAQACQQFPWQL